MAGLGRCAELFPLWLILATLGVGSAPARAQEPLLARVLAIAPDAVTLRPVSPGGETADILVLPLDAPDAPPELRVGSLVRLWPADRARGRAARLDALDGALDASDRTGVRSRLRHGGASGGGRHGGR